MGVIIDTSLLIAGERGKLDLPALFASWADAPVAMAAITATELLFGVERAGHALQRRRRSAFVEGILERIPAVPYGVLEARAHAQLWAELSRTGSLIGAHDLQVAATALAQDWAVATLNHLEFSRVPGLTLTPVQGT